MLTPTQSALAMLRWQGFAGSHHRGTAGWLIWLMLELVVVGVLVWALTRSKKNAA